MTDQEKVAALAAELERIGKMLGGIDSEHCTIDEFWSRTYVHSPEIVLAALAGVAAEVCVLHGLTIETDNQNDYIVKLCGETIVADGWFEAFKTYHEALVAALKQIETEKKQ